MSNPLESAEGTDVEAPEAPAAELESEEVASEEA